MSISDDRPSSKPTNVRWVVFGLGCGTSWLLYLHRYTFALVKPKLETEWGLDNKELGLLDSAFSFCYSTFQVPAGMLADWLGAHLFLGSIILLWSLALGLHAWAPSPAAMWYARAGFGASQAGAYSALNRVTRIWFPRSSRTIVQGWLGIFSGRMGGLSANIIFAFLLLGILEFDWRTGLYILTAAGVVHALAFLVLFRNSPRNHPLANEAEADLIEEIRTSPQTSVAQNFGAKRETQSKRMSVAKMFRRMSPRSILNLLALNLQSTLSTIADNIYSNWIPLFLAQVHNLEFKRMGLYSALPLLGGAFGGAIGGYLNDRMIRITGSRRWSRTMVGLTGKSIAGVLIFCALLSSYDSPYRFCVFLFFVKLFGDWSLASAWGTVTDIGGRTTATVYAFNNSVASTLAIPAPIMYGIISKDHGWEPVFMIVGVTYLLCAASWLLIDCTIPLMAEDAAGSPGPAKEA